MKSVVIAMAAAVALSASPVFAGGNADAGKIKSATCAGCHGANGVSSVPTFPTLAGQYQTYLVYALEAYKSGARKNAMMNGFAANLTDEDIADLAAFFSKQDGGVTVLSGE